MRHRGSSGKYCVIAAINIKKVTCVSCFPYYKLCAISPPKPQLSFSSQHVHHQNKNKVAASPPPQPWHHTGVLAASPPLSELGDRQWGQVTE